MSKRPPVTRSRLARKPVEGPKHGVLEQVLRLRRGQIDYTVEQIEGVWMNYDGKVWEWR